MSASGPSADGSCETTTTSLLAKSPSACHPVAGVEAGGDGGTGDGGRGTWDGDGGRGRGT